MTKLLDPGKYVVAVSGGVDSVCLLDMLSHDKGLDLVVAHFDHGIRPDSAEDALFVNNLSKFYDLPYFSERATLGPNASEAIARASRYEFLDRIRLKTGAAAMVTAHHQDDVIETAILNVLRGTKRRGLVSLQSTTLIKRPLLETTKTELLDYAKRHHLEWREDASNVSLQYERNRIRKLIEFSLTPGMRARTMGLLKTIADQNQEIDRLVAAYLAEHSNEYALNRPVLNKLYLAEAYEIVAGWLRGRNIGFDEEAIKRLTIGARLLQNGSQIDITGGYYCQLSRTEITLMHR
jgi:tRNA(Ile)-lysidine synthetase-like protein